MSLAFKTNSILDQEYATKCELHYGLHVSYARIAQAIRDGKQLSILLTIKYRSKSLKLSTYSSRP